MAKSNDSEDVPRERKEPRPDFTQQPAYKKLPKELQDTLDSEDKLWEVLVDGHGAESTESNVRYAAYATRVRTILQSAHRYVAYTSDIGESFRPIAHPYLVKGAYGISWAYLIGDVSHEGYKAYLRNQRVLNPETTVTEETTNAIGEKLGLSERRTEGQQTTLGPGITEGVRGLVKEGLEPGRVPTIEDYRSVMAQRAVFQSIASMGIPAFTIHSIVRYSGQALKNSKYPRIKTWGPIGLGLAAVPFLPFVLDHPVETAVEWVFHKGFETFGGPEAVVGRPVVGQQELRQLEYKKSAAKEKEL